MKSNEEYAEADRLHTGDELPNTGKPTRQANVRDRDLSIIIPAFNEAGSLLELHHRLTMVYPHDSSTRVEYIYINDGSTDNTLDILRGLQQQDARIRIIHFRKNMGKTAALAAGFHVSTAPIIATIDADLQNDPDDIPAIVTMVLAGNDLVCGWRTDRRDPWHKTVPSLVINGIVRLLTGLRLHDINCGLKVMKREIVESLHLLGKQHRYIPLKAYFGGFQVIEQQIRHYPREHGRSKYGSSRFLEGVFDLITVIFMGKFDRSPFYLFGGFGLLCFVLGLTILGYLTVGWFFGQWIAARPLFSIGILLVIFGFQLMSIGLLAELFIALLSPVLPAHWQELTRVTPPDTESNKHRNSLSADK